MSKIVPFNEREEEPIPNEKPFSYVYIKCSPPDKETGEMYIDLSYEGDPLLISFMMDSAHNYLES